jgi:hypothetical protein
MIGGARKLRALVSASPNFGYVDKVQAHKLYYRAYPSEIGLEEGYLFTAALINNGHEIHGLRIL